MIIYTGIHILNFFHTIICTSICLFLYLLPPFRLPFRHCVRSIHWSCNIAPHSCYMCVVHTQHLSVWKVDGVIPKLNFKQVRKLNVQPISKGKRRNCRFSSPELKAEVSLSDHPLSILCINFSLFLLLQF